MCIGLDKLPKCTSTATRCPPWIRCWRNTYTNKHGIGLLREFFQWRNFSSPFEYGYCQRAYRSTLEDWCRPSRAVRRLFGGNHHFFSAACFQVIARLRIRENWSIHTCTNKRGNYSAKNVFIARHFFSVPQFQLTARVRSLLVGQTHRVRLRIRSCRQLRPDLFQLEHHL